MSVCDKAWTWLPEVSFGSEVELKLRTQVYEHKYLI